MIYTSYYDNLENLPDNIIPVSIAGKAPKDYKGKEYKKLAPKLDFWKKWEETKDNYFYAENFKEKVLDKLSVEEVLEDLEKLKPQLSVDMSFDICLICYEKPEEFCHRHLVANWLKSNGYECEEYGEEKLLDVGFYGFDENDKFYTKDYRTFVRKDGTILSKDELYNWAMCLNSPWSQTHETFNIRCNCVNSYIKMVDSDPTFVCEKEIVGFDGITATILGYGFTEEEALHNCISNFKYLQKTYNPEDDCF